MTKKTDQIDDESAVNAEKQIVSESKPVKPPCVCSNCRTVEGVKPAQIIK